MKKILKNLLVWQLVFCIFAVGLPVLAESVNDTEIVSEDLSQYRKLLALGLVSEIEETQLLQTITKAGFIKIVMEAINLDVQEPNYEEDSVFSDVNRYTDDYPYIYAAYKAGYVKGATDGTLEPDAPVSELFASTIIQRVLGYDIVADFTGGYEAGYLKMGNRLGIFDGIVCPEMGYTYNDIYKLISNMAETAVYDQTIFGDEAKFEEGRTFLYTYHKILTTEGQMSQNTVTKLTSPLNDVTDKTVTVGGVNFECYTSAYDDLLGYQVLCYYKNEDDGNDRVIYIEKQNGLSNDLTIKGENIISLDKVYTDDNRTVFVNISQVADVIYNGVAYNSYTNLYTLLSTSDEVTYISSQGDGVYDVIKVVKYKYGLVQSVDPYNKIVNLSTNVQLNMDIEEQFVNCYDENGMKLSIDDIKPKMIASYILSLNTAGVKALTLYIGNDVVEETLQTISDDEYCFGDRSFTKATEFSGTLKLGKIYKVYVGKNNKIVAVESLNDDYLFAVAIKDTLVNNPFNKVYKVRLFTQEGEFKDLQFADEFTANETEYEVENDADISTLRGLMPGNTLIAYKLDKDGNIKNVLTPNSVDGIRTLAQFGTEYSSFGNNNINLEAIYDSSTVFFTIPSTVSSTNEKRYKVFSEPVSGAASAKAYALHKNEIPLADACVLVTDVASPFNVDDSTGTPLVIVENFADSLDKYGDDIVKKLIVFKGGEKVEFYLDDEELLTTTPLQAGDVITYTRVVGSEDTIRNYRLIYRENDPDKKAYLHPDVRYFRTTSSTAYVDYILGTAQYCDGTYLVYTTKNHNNSFTEITCTFKIAGASIYVYDPTDNICRVGSAGDLIKGKKLVMNRKNGGAVNTIIVYDPS